MQALQREAWRRLGPAAESHPGDLEWWLHGLMDPDTDTSGRICLWENDDGQLRGWSWIQGSELEWMTHPAERDNELRGRMLDWHAEQMPHLLPDADDLTLSTWSTTLQPDLGHMLVRRGFEMSGDVLVHHTQELTRETTSPTAPPTGYTIRAIAGDEEVSQRVTVHRSAFQPSRMTDARHRRVMRAPTYRPDLDIVAVAPDGTLAAFCLAWYDEPLRIGLLEPVGTHADHRRRGLASAVCREALRRMRDLGAERASVLSRGDSPPALGLYRSVGFMEVMRSVEWQRRVRREPSR